MWCRGATQLAFKARSGLGGPGAVGKSEGEFHLRGGEAKKVLQGQGGHPWSEEPVIVTLGKSLFSVPQVK